jgi:hypothetical protein
MFSLLLLLYTDDPSLQTLYEESASAIVQHMVRMKGEDRDFTCILLPRSFFSL